jgi:hypothetical protein
MNIYLSFDYEIYFGENPGTVDKCIIYPTTELIRIAEKYNARFSFFVDCGFLIKLNKHRKDYPQLENDYTAIVTQLNYLSRTGHDIQLHIHPHWEDSYYDGERWVMDVSRYKLSDFNESQIEDIVCRYKKEITDITGKEVFAFRAGGWCLQPFDKLKNAFVKHRITLDSTVFKNGLYTSENYHYDFRDVPEKDLYRFESDPTQEDKTGFFTEMPIAAIRNSPLFFWTLFLLGRKNPYFHKPLGDGRAMAAKGYRKKLLTSFSNNPVSVDGYNARLLEKALKQCIKKKFDHFVIIGHPKALSRYSLQKIEQFIDKNNAQHRFITYTHFKNNK